MTSDGKLRLGSTTDADDEQLLLRLRTDFSGHRIWRGVRYDGQFGDWVATLHDPAAGVDPTVICSDADTLRKALAREAERAKQRNRSGWSWA
jgi:hypothetical protein